MISLKEACDIVRRYIAEHSGEVAKITEIRDADTFWLFRDETGDRFPIGYSPFTVDKKSGKMGWLQSPTYLTLAQRNALEHAKVVQIPE